MTKTRIGLGLLGMPDVHEMMHLARRAEELDYDSIWLTETRFTRDGVTTAAAVATATSRVQIGTAVINPFTRGAVLTGVTFATLDELARGRIVLGIGPGSPHILDKQGYAFARPVTRMREWIEITQQLLTGAAVTYEGATTRVSGVKLDFPPTRPRIPVYLGVTGPRALELAGEIADGVLLNGFTSAAYAQRAIAHIRAGAERAGRSPDAVDVGSMLAVSVNEDSARAKDAIRPLVATYLANFPNIAREADLAPAALEAIRTAYFDGGPAVAASLVSDAVVDQLVCAGTPGECRALIAARRAAGVTLPILGLAFGDREAALASLIEAGTS